MSQLAIHGADALDLDRPDPFADTVVLERLPIRAAEPFASPRLRLAVPDHHEGGRRPAGARAAAPAATRRPQGAVGRGPGRRPVRLTRRGRLACVIVLALLATAVMFAVGVVPSQASPASTGAASTGAASASASAGVAASGAADGGGMASVVVQPGDSLWSIAVAAVPGADPRATVQTIIDLNHLAGVSIEAGQTLRLPA